MSQPIAEPKSKNAESDRIRVLIVMEQCNPEWPSVPLVGYKLFRHIAEIADVTLVTHGRNETALSGLHPEADIIYLPESAASARWHKVATWLSTIRGSVVWQLYHALTFPTYAEFDRNALRTMKGRVEAGEFDIVHAITPMMPRYPYRIHRACGNTPFVIGPVNGGVPYPKGFDDIANAEFSFLNWLRGAGRVLLLGYRDTYESADHVFSGSRYTKELLENLFTLKHKVEVLAENGLDASFFADQTRRGRDGSDGTLEALFVGRLVPYKGADIAIEALSLLPPSLRSATRLTIVGDGPERASLEAKASALKLDRSVRFEGWVPHSETLAYYRSADVFCFPSIREFGGAVVLEAMANELPCIVVDNGGVGEYVTDEAGFKITPISREQVVGDVAQCMQRLHERPMLRREMGVAAGLRAREYAWPSKAARIVAAYKSLLEARAGARAT